MGIVYVIISSYIPWFAITVSTYSAHVCKHRARAAIRVLACNHDFYAPCPLPNTL
jgi:hypothetical protein